MAALRGGTVSYDRGTPGVQDNTKPMPDGDDAVPKLSTSGICLSVFLKGWRQPESFGSSSVGSRNLALQAALSCGELVAVPQFIWVPH